jgi:hypothetical protein
VRYEILSPTTGQSMTLQYADWLRLLGLDSRYGGIPDESLYHYYDEDGVAIPEEVAGYMAEALAGARTAGSSPGGTLPGGRVSPEGDDIADDPAALSEGSLEGAPAHFAGARIGIVSKFVGMGRTGELGVTPNQP